MRKFHQEFAFLLVRAFEFCVSFDAARLVVQELAVVDTDERGVDSGVFCGGAYPGFEKVWESFNFVPQAQILKQKRFEMTEVRFIC